MSLEQWILWLLPPLAVASVVIYHTRQKIASLIPSTGWATKVLGFLKPYAFGTIGVLFLVLVVASFLIGSHWAGATSYLLWIVPLLALGIVVTYIIMSKIKLDAVRWVALAAIWVPILSIILPNLPAYGPSGPAIPTVAQAAAQAQAERDAGRCPRHRVLHTYGPTLETVNPEGYCQPALWFARHCIFVWQINATKEQGPFCDMVGNAMLTLPDDIEKVRSADETFQDYVELRPPQPRAMFR